MNKCVLLLGGNLGNVAVHFKTSQQLLSEQGFDIVGQSSLYQSEPWGFEAKDLFLNQVLICQTRLSPHMCLEVTQGIEQSIGRKTKSRNLNYSSRLIDIDILFYNNDIVETNDLTIPHPRLHLRNFTLLPLLELMPDYIHPKLKKSIEWLCQNSEDKDLCEKVS